MGAPVLNGPFTMPMFRNFVPRKLQPWLYIFLAVSFQLSGGLYMANLSHMVSETSLMREDLQMCLYCNLAGMAVYFPILFRMKFRFTNKTLLTAASLGVIVCNLIAPYTTFLPLLWTLCFIEGICKIQGTFEAMSTIQLWMTPKRDFTVFFPLLHIIILGSMQVSSILATYFGYYLHWSYMHWFMAGIMLVDLLIVQGCTRHFRIVKKFPLFGVDWLGAILWALLLLEIAYFFDYGEFYDWWNSPVMQGLAVVIIITLGFCVGRMLHIHHPYIEPEMWGYRRLLPILILITLVEAFLATEHVLEGVFHSSVMHYEEMVAMQLDWPMLVGVVAGSLFAYWWMHVRQLSYLRLITVGIASLACYLLTFYFVLSADIHISQLFLPTLCRGFAYAILSATFMVCLEEIMTFRHFFQALSVFNMLHMVVGGVMGGALYGRWLSYYVSDNMARYGAAVDRVAFSSQPFALDRFIEQFVSQIMEVSIRQIYGWTLYACVFLLLLFLLYDAPVRRELKLMPSWRSLRKEAAQMFSKGKPKENAVPPKEEA